MDYVMVEYLGEIEFGKLQQFGEMTVFPVFSANNGKVEYLSLKEAMNRNLLEITEVDDSGSVPELKVKNLAEIPVLILDGEELMGAKQNRVVNTTILLKEDYNTIIPVSCVEQGRWSYTSRNFQDSDRIASYNIRNVKSASVKRSVERTGQYSSDQGAVWNEVNKLQDRMEVKSPTSAMSDVYESKIDDLDDYIKAFELLENQKGILVVIHGEIAGFDVISSKSAYMDLHKKLIKSYALDAMGNDKKTKSLNAEMAQKFLKEIMECDESKNKSVGYGYDYRFASDSYIGSSLVCMDEVIHVSFFKSLEIKEEEIGEMARYSQRANFRM